MLGHRLGMHNRLQYLYQYVFSVTCPLCHVTCPLCHILCRDGGDRDRVDNLTRVVYVVNGDATLSFKQPASCFMFYLSLIFCDVIVYIR